MLQVRVHGPNDVRVDDVAPPSPGPLDAVVRIAACGICGSDLSYIKMGGMAGPGPEPLCLGHEMAGVVDWVGADVQRVRVGDRVVVQPGNEELGRIGGGGPEGGLTPELLVRAADSGLLHAVPDHVPLDVAAFAEPLAVGMHAVEQADVRPGDGVAVFGCGPIGLAAIATLLDRGHERVVGIDLSPTRLALAEGLGAQAALNPTEVDVWEELARLHGTEPFMFGPTPATAAFIEASGSGRVITDILNRGRVGGRMSVVALHYEPIPTSFLMVLMKEFTVRGSMEYPVRFADAIDLLARRDLSALITHRYPLDRFDDALGVLQGSKDCGKVMVAVDAGVDVSPGAIDLSDPHVLLREDVLDDPSELYDRLREDVPVWQIPGQDTFLVSEPKLIRDAVNRPEDFSSNLVSLLHDGGDGCPVALDMAPPGDPIHVLATADPPVHTVHRKLLQQHLSPAAVAALEPEISRIVEDQLEVLLGSEGGVVDAVATFSDPVPSRTVCALVGLPESDAARITQLVGDTGALLDGTTLREGMSSAMHAAMELAAYVREHLDRTLALPAEQRRGLLGVFSSQIESGEVSAGEVGDMLVVLVSAGSETTASLIATTIATLAQDAELQQHLRAHPEELPDALERILRADGPFQFHYRYVPADTELGGVQIPAQSRVLLMWAAANRPAPGSSALPVVDDERGPAPHFAFGRGLHFCIGAPVARLEARLAIERLLAATDHFELDPDQPVVRRPSIFIRRHAALPLRVRAR